MTSLWLTDYKIDYKNTTEKEYNIDYKKDYKKTARTLLGLC